MVSFLTVRVNSSFGVHVSMYIFYHESAFYEPSRMSQNLYSGEIKSHRPSCEAKGPKSTDRSPLFFFYPQIMWTLFFISKCLLLLSHHALLFNRRRLRAVLNLCNDCLKKNKKQNVPPYCPICTSGMTFKNFPHVGNDWQTETDVSVQHLSIRNTISQL